MSLIFPRPSVLSMGSIYEVGRGKRYQKATGLFDWQLKDAKKTTL